MKVKYRYLTYFGEGEVIKLYHTPEYYYLPDSSIPNSVEDCPVVLITNEGPPPARFWFIQDSEPYRDISDSYWISSCFFENWQDREILKNYLIKDGQYYNAAVMKNGKEPILPEPNHTLDGIDTMQFSQDYQFLIAIVSGDQKQVYFFTFDYKISKNKPSDIFAEIYKRFPEVDGALLIDYKTNSDSIPILEFSITNEIYDVTQNIKELEPEEIYSKMDAYVGEKISAIELFSQNPDTEFIVPFPNLAFSDSLAEKYTIIKNGKKISEPLEEGKRASIGIAYNNKTKEYSISRKSEIEGNPNITFIAGLFDKRNKYELPNYLIKDGEPVFRYEYENVSEEKEGSGEGVEDNRLLFGIDVNGQPIIVEEEQFTYVENKNEVLTWFKRYYPNIRDLIILDNTWKISADSIKPVPFIITRKIAVEEKIRSKQFNFALTFDYGKNKTKRKEFPKVCWKGSGRE